MIELDTTLKGLDTDSEILTCLSLTPVSLEALADDFLMDAQSDVRIVLRRLNKRFKGAIVTGRVKGRKGNYVWIKSGHFNRVADAGTKYFNRMGY